MRLVKITSNLAPAKNQTVEYKINKGVYLIDKSFFNFDIQVTVNGNFADKRYFINVEQIQVEVDGIKYEDTVYPWAAQKKNSSTRYGTQNAGHVYQLQQPGIGNNGIQYPLNVLLQCFQQQAKMLRIDEMAYIRLRYRNDDRWNVVETDAGAATLKEQTQNLYLYEILDQGYLTKQSNINPKDVLQTYVQKNFVQSSNFTYKVPMGYVSEFIMFGIQRKTFPDNNTLPDDLTECDNFVTELTNKTTYLYANNKQESCAQMKMLNQNEQIFYQSGCALVKIYQLSGENEFQITLNQGIADQGYTCFFGYQYARIQQ